MEFSMMGFRNYMVFFHFLYSSFMQCPQGRYCSSNASFSDIKNTRFSFFIFLPEKQVSKP